MARSPNHRLQAHFQRLISEDAAAGDVAARLELMEAIRSASAQDSRALDSLMLGAILDLRRSIQQARELQQELRGVLEKMSSPPWYPAWLLRVLEAEGRPRALVHCNGGARLVEFGPGVDPGSLARGAAVYLSHEQNAILASAGDDLLRCGETAFFDRSTADGRLVLKHRDEEIVVDAVPPLEIDSLEPGDEVRFDRRALLAFERIESAAARRYLVDEGLDVGSESVGGQDRALERLLHALTAWLAAPELAARYGLGGRRSVLLCGPPGCGKTSLARVAASEISRLSGRRCELLVVKPGEWESPWVGETQANIRHCFHALRRAAKKHRKAVLFLDDVESAGRHRGAVASRHADSFAAALLAELDGFEGRGEVAIVSATNRKDLIDPALLERLSDVEITVPRPDSSGAARIFEIHFGEKVPVRPDGPAAGETRREIVETAVSRLYAPNADGALCVLHFRDGKARPVSARELVSGRLIEQICRLAREAAFARHVAGGAEGVGVPDMEKAVCEAIERLSTTLTRTNAREYLDDLPQDVDVVRVETPRRRVTRPIRYLNTE